MSKKQGGPKNRIENAIIGRKTLRKNKTKDLKRSKRSQKQVKYYRRGTKAHKEIKHSKQSHITRKERENHVQIPKGEMSSVHNQLKNKTCSEIKTQTKRESWNYILNKPSHKRYSSTYLQNPDSKSSTQDKTQI